MNSKQGGFPPTVNAAIDTTDVSAALKNWTWQRQKIQPLLIKTGVDECVDHQATGGISNTKYHALGKI